MGAHKTFKESGKCRITTETVKQHEIDCDKCGGTGKVLDDSVAELCRRWRESLNVSGWELAVVAKVSKSSVSKFESGLRRYSEAYKRKVVAALEAFADGT